MEIFYSSREDNPITKQHLQKTNLKVTQYINKGEISLTKLYNSFLKNSKEDIVVLVHDDVRLGKNWHKKVLNYFNTTDYGILGVAGSASLDNNCVWWQNKLELAGVVTHQQIINKKTKNNITKYSEKFDEVLPVCVVDGLFIAVHLGRVKEYFNENIDGFHFYDVSFCIDNFNRGVKIGVMTNLDVTHKSIGKLSEEWQLNRNKMVGLYKEKLPIKIQPQIIFTDVVVNKYDTKVAIIIPTKDKTDLLFTTLDSILNTTKHENYKIYVADTGSTDENKASIIERYGDKIVFIQYNYYNFAKINNDVVENHIDSDTEYIVFCNNDLKLLNNCIDQVIDCYNKNKNRCGTIGVKLYFGNNYIQHGGILTYMENDGHLILTHLGVNSLYGSSDKTQEVVGNTGAFLGIRKKLFDKIKFNTQYIECFEDVELNLRCIIQGYVNINIGSAKSYHYESQTRKENPLHLENVNRDYFERILPFFNKNVNSLMKFLKF